MRVSQLAAVVATLLLVNVSVSARAVNISNAWMLPEEGFPVFYRYFRDRISWNEADAVCQFHHANLVTVDTTSQYDAIRAYLKELDIANNVWIGLSRAGDKPNFTWRDFRDLSAADYWQEAIPDGGGESLCAAMDPAADFRWHALTCAGPEVASFICELPVPSWANGPDGCLITELPSLTVLYIPEQTAVELTSDCGLGGTKRIVCKGKSDRDELTRRLACTDDSIPLTEGRTQSPIAVTQSTSPASTSVKHSTKPNAIWTSNTIDTGDYGTPTRHRRGTEETSMPPATGPTTEIPATLGTTSQRSGVSSVETEPTSIVDSNQEEFASAINQGQLFSIIENGTLFDIIELNGTEENKTLAPDASPPSPVVAVTVTSAQSASTTPAVTVATSPTTPTLPSITTEHTGEVVPDIPIIGDLHRSFRKQVPSFHKPDVNIDIDVVNDIQIQNKQNKPKENQKDSIQKHVGNLATAILNIARFAEAALRKPYKMDKPKPQSYRLDEVKLLDASNTTKSSFFVIVTTGATRVKQTPTVSPSPSPRSVMKHPATSRLPVTVANLPPSPNRQETTDNTNYESEPTGKPNRQRQLTRSNRRSFYPYFFSRVLG